MEILSSRTLLISRDPAALADFYRNRIGLAVAREYPGGTVFHTGTGLLEIPAHLASGTAQPRSPTDVLWLQVRDIATARAALAAAAVPIVEEPATKPWGLIEMTATDPDGRRLIVVEIPTDHPLRRDVRE